MPRLLTLRDLSAADLVVLRELVRFGVLAADQMARRYRDPFLATTRVPLLRDGQVIEEEPDTLDGAHVYSPTRLGESLAHIEVDRLKRNDHHLAHDVAVVDLADYLLDHHPDLQWRTERELRRTLEAVGPPPARVPGDNHHRPDGLLLGRGELVAVELEHSDKGEQRYTRISRWFATEYRLDRVRWYVDQPRIARRLRQVNHQHGFGRDIALEIEPFPPGVVVRERSRP